jgi:hypothetical protein
MKIPEWKKSATLFEFVNSRPYIHDEKTNLDYWMYREEKKLYVCFQASSEKADWIADFNFFPKKVEPFEGVFVHRGLWQQYEGIRNKFLDQLYQGVTDVYISGYSLGGGVSDFALYDAAWHDHRDSLHILFRCISFEAPRVFIENYKVRGLCDDHQRIRVKGDVIPHLPPKLFGFCDTGNIFKIGKWSPFFWKQHAPASVEKSLLKEFGE